VTARVARLFVAVLGAVAALAVLGISWLVYGDRSLPSQPVDVTVNKGWSTADIGAQLERQGVVRSETLFRLFVRAIRPGLNIEAALYTFPAHEALPDVVSRLAAGGRPLEVWVTIPEGYTAAQIAHRLEARGLFPAESFSRVAMGNTLAIDGARSKNLEGFLYPDTYSISRGATPDTVASVMTNQFLKELPSNYVVAARRLHYNVVQIITVASLVEREAKVDGERALMAGVYYNRLQRGMPLEVDATIEYALPYHKTALSLSDLSVDSPYNTYTHVGLPPTPIANPGKKSIEAAFHPAHTDYLYYVYKGNGRHEFSRTLQEQQRAEQQYLH
jgi:UPF0755 protein